MESRWELVTARLRLVPVTPSEADLLADGIAPAPAVADYPHADTSAAARLARGTLEVDNWVPGFGMYLIVAEGLVVGDIGFHAPPDERGAVEVGYGLAPSARGNGWATEALEALAVWALAHGASAVVAETDVDNTASQGVLTRAGFRPLRFQEATTRRYRRVG